MMAEIPSLQAVIPASAPAYMSFFSAGVGGTYGGGSALGERFGWGIGHLMLHSQLVHACRDSEEQSN
jgi:hypothetical protein